MNKGEITVKISYTLAKKGLEPRTLLALGFYLEKEANQEPANESTLRSYYQWSLSEARQATQDLELMGYVHRMNDSLQQQNQTIKPFE